MQLTIYPPPAKTPTTTNQGESEKVELRQKLLEMIRQNESQRRKTEK